MKQFIKLVTILGIFAAQDTYAVENCGQVKIDNFLSGSRHGSMIRITNRSCGDSGWICLDPNAETMSAEESRRLYEQAYDLYKTKKSFNLFINENTYPSACGDSGRFPSVEDLRITY